MVLRSRAKHQGSGRLYCGVQKLVHKLQKKIDEAAIMWNKTKDEKYKKLWYQLVRSMDGFDHSKRRTISIDSVNERDVRGYGPGIRH